jgi:isopentenyl-diphosphate delta-isomerase
MKRSKVILVNEQDLPVGEMDKQDVHRKGLLHRAFSVFIFNSRGEMLLQQRAPGKYHSGGLWSNACCSHPAPGEDTESAVQRRLKEELGFQTGVEKIFHFIYRAELDNQVTEHELDHVFAGEYDGVVMPDHEEVNDYCFKKMEELKESLQLCPQKYTVWFRLAFPLIEKWWSERYAAIRA